MVQNLEIVRGTTCSFGITLTDASGASYTLEDGQVLVFAMKRRPKDDERLLIKQITNIANGEYYLELEPNDTMEFKPGRYYYDVGMQQGDNVFYNIIETSSFDIKPNITELGDGS